MEDKDIFKLPSFEAGEKEEKLNTELLSSAVELNKSSDSLRTGLKEHYDRLALKEKEIESYVNELKIVYNETKSKRMAFEKVISLL